MDTGAFTGYVPGQGERELPSPFDAKKLYYHRDADDLKRIERYLRNEALMDVRAHSSAAEASESAARRREDTWIPIDFFGMLARLMRHYTFGPEFEVRGRGPENADPVRRIFEHSDMLELLNQSAEVVASLGDAVFRVDIEDAEDEENPEAGKIPQASIRAIRPAHFFPELDPLDATRMVGATLAWVFPADDDYKAKVGIASDHVVLMERHRANEVTYELREWDGKDLGEELGVDTLFPELQDGPTGIDEIPIVHVGIGVRSGEYWGNGDFTRIERIVFALERRLTQEDEVLDKHARPKLIVGPGILDAEGRSKLDDFDIIEIDPSILEKAVKPEYLTWDFQIEGIQHEIEKLEEYLFITTETSPASFGLERDGSQVESARALRFKAHRTVNKVNDLRVAYAKAIKAIFRIAQKMEVAALEQDGLNAYLRGPIELVWPDPIIEDQEAEVQNYVAMKGTGLVSRKRAVKDLHNLTDNEADAEVQEILQDQVDEAAAATTSAPEVQLTGAAAGPEVGAPVPPTGPPPPVA